MANASKATYAGMTLIWRLVRQSNSPTEPKFIAWGDSVITGSANPDVNLFKPQTEGRATGTSSQVLTTQLGDTYRVTGTITCATGAKTITEAGLFDVATSISPTTTTVGTLASGGTTVSLTSITGFPQASLYYAQIAGTSQTATTGNPEVVLVTASSGNTVTITRNQLGSAANVQVNAIFTAGGDGGAQGSGATTSQTVTTATWQGTYGGNMFCHADFAGIALSVNDSINFTFNSQLTG